MESIPQELYTTIFDHLPYRELAQVATASRRFHHETSRLLYCDVDLAEGSKQDIISWANAVAQNRFLSGLVRTLYLPAIVPVKSYPHIPLRELQTALKNTFGAIDNLTFLEVMYLAENQGDMEHLLNFDIFSTSLFRLKTFCDPESGLKNPYEQRLFLSQQTEIERWEANIEQQFPEEFFSSSLLPRLSDMTMNVWNLPILKFAASRALVYLSVDCTVAEGEDVPFKQVMEQLRRCHQTLQHLECCFWDSVTRHLRSRYSRKALES